MKRLIKIFLVICIIATLYITITNPTYLLNKKDGVVNVISSAIKMQKKDIIVYYKSESNEIIPVTVNVNKKDIVIEKILDFMVENEENINMAKEKGLYPIIPLGSVESVSIKNDVATVKLNCSLLNFTSEERENAFITGIIYALTEYEGVNSVSFIAEDKDKLNYGTILNKEYFRENINKLNYSKNAKSKQTIYLIKKYNDIYNLVPFSVYNLKSTITLEELIKKHFELCKNEEVSNIYIEEKMLIKNILIKSENVYIYLSEDFNNLESEVLSLYKKSLALTIKENSNSIKKVRFIIEKKEENSGIIETILINDVKS